MKFTAVPIRSAQGCAHMVEQTLTLFTRPLLSQNQHKFYEAVPTDAFSGRQREYRKFLQLASSVLKFCTLGVQLSSMINQFCLLLAK